MLLVLPTCKDVVDYFLLCFNLRPPRHHLLCHHLCYHRISPAPTPIPTYVNICLSFPSSSEPELRPTYSTLRQHISSSPCDKWHSFSYPFLSRSSTIICFFFPFVTPPCIFPLFSPSAVYIAHLCSIPTLFLTQCTSHFLFFLLDRVLPSSYPL